MAATAASIDDRHRARPAQDVEDEAPRHLGGEGRRTHWWAGLSNAHLLGIANEHDHLTPTDVRDLAAVLDVA